MARKNESPQKAVMFEFTQNLKLSLLTHIKFIYL